MGLNKKFDAEIQIQLLKVCIVREGDQSGFDGSFWSGVGFFLFVCLCLNSKIYSLGF